MLKRAVFIESGGVLKVKNNQLLFVPEKGDVRQIPIEDVGYVIVESLYVSMTAHSMQALADSNVAVVFCDASHMPSALMLSMNAHATTQRQTKAQLDATDALTARLWRQTVEAKIKNQAACLDRGGRDGAEKLRIMAGNVRNGDPENVEGSAAQFYFKWHYPDGSFKRHRNGNMPNGLLNYAYAIIRATMARALIGSGLLCIRGIHHSNQYNAFVLADDIMEPYRPFVDDVIFNSDLREAEKLTTEIKHRLAMIPFSDVCIRDMRRPMINAMSLTSASLARCFLKEETEISYPEFCRA